MRRLISFLKKCANSIIGLVCFSAKKATARGGNSKQSAASALSLDNENSELEAMSNFWKSLTNWRVKSLCFDTLRSVDGTLTYDRRKMGIMTRCRYNHTESYRRLILKTKIRLWFTTWRKETISSQVSIINYCICSISAWMSVLELFGFASAIVHRRLDWRSEFKLVEHAEPKHIVVHASYFTCERANWSQVGIINTATDYFFSSVAFHSGSKTNIFVLWCNVLVVHASETFFHHSRL